MYVYVSVRVWLCVCSCLSVCDMYVSACVLYVCW